MRHALLLAAVSLSSWLALSAPADACTCAPASAYEHYESKGTVHVLHVRVEEVAETSEQRVIYRARLIEPDFKGCLAADAQVLLSTAASSAACGVELPLGEEMLVYTRPVQQASGDAGVAAEPVLSVTLCSGLMPWSRASEQLRDYLRTRPRSCGSATCSNGEPVVACFVDPCATSRCDVEGAVCASSYCGGCDARWYLDGARVCAAPEDAAR